MPPRRLSIWMWLIIGVIALSGHAASATTVTISRGSDGVVVCSGWAVTPNIIATAARCVLATGHYSVSIGDKTFQVWRIWLHPKFSPEYSYRVIDQEQLDYDVAILQIVQRDLTVDAYDHLPDKDRLAGADLFAIRAKRSDRPDASEVEALPGANVERKPNGVVIFTRNSGYNICYGDIGVPIFAKLNDARFAVGIIVNNMPRGKSPARFCGNELHVIDVATISEFVRSIYSSDK